MDDPCDHANIRSCIYHFTPAILPITKRQIHLRTLGKHDDSNYNMHFLCNIGKYHYVAAQFTCLCTVEVKCLWLWDTSLVSRHVGFMQIYP